MTGFTSVDSNGGVFEDEGPAFIGVATQTRLLAVYRGLHHSWASAHFPRGRGGAVGVMAIAALDDSFVHPVLEGHRKLAANVGVAAVAKFSLPLGQEQFGCGRLVDGVAVRTDDVRLCMRGPSNLSSGDVFRVALQASLKSFLLRHDGKGADGRLATFGVEVRFTWTMATFTTGQFWRLLSDRYALEVGVARKRKPYVRVASLTDIAADVTVRRGCLRTVRKRKCAEKDGATNED